GGLAAAAAQVVQLRAADPPAADDLDPAHGRSVEREDPLDADTAGDLAHGEGLVDAPALAPDAHALERLDALLGALAHEVEHLHGISGSEVGCVEIGRASCRESGESV